jgi:hypothetical protein
LTIRIERCETERGVTVELHGWLREEALGELDAVCGSVAGPLHLNLSRLVDADQASRRALRLRIRSGARIEGASPYIRLLLDSEV